MLKIILIRPGSTEFDAQCRLVGTLDLPLSSAGSSEVAATIQGINGAQLATVYCCPGQSSLDTAEAVAEAFHVKCKPIKTLANANYGLWQGLQVDEVRRKQPRVFKQWQEHPETVCPPEGEMLSDVRQRVEASLAKLLKKHKEGTIALVVPEPLAGIARSLLQHTELGDSWRSGGECGTWETITVEEPAAVGAKSVASSNGVAQA